MSARPLPGGAKPVREAFDVAAAHAWLRGLAPELTTEPEVTQFSGGASNLTYLLRYPNRDLILRRPPAGTKAASAHDMAREYRIQAALKATYPLVPTMVGLCEDHAVLGSDFYVMERVEGVIVRGELPKGQQLDRAAAAKLSQTFVDELAALHAVDVEAAGLGGLGKGPGYVGRQLSGWSGRYDKARTWHVPGWHGVRSWLAAHQPTDVGAVLIHGDFRFDNLVLDARDLQRVVGVLDWEMATVGDPLMDLGNSLAYWIEAGDDRLAQAMRRQPTHLPGMLTRREVVARYLERTGREVESFDFYIVYGLFRLAVIVQQIAYRYHKGQTKNPAFKHFWLFNHYLHWRATRAMRGRW